MSYWQVIHTKRANVSSNCSICNTTTNNTLSFHKITFKTMQADRQKTFFIIIFWRYGLLWQFHCCRCTHLNILAQRRCWNYKVLPKWHIYFGFLTRFWKYSKMLLPWFGNHEVRTLIKRLYKSAISWWVCSFFSFILLFILSLCYESTSISDPIKVKYTKFNMKQI